MQEFLTPEIIDGAKDVVISVISLTLTIALPALSAQVYRFIGVKIEEKHLRTLHTAIETWANVAMKNGKDTANKAAYDSLRAYLKESVPDALKALNPSADVLIRLRDRYTYFG